MRNIFLGLLMTISSLAYSQTNSVNINPTTTLAYMINVPRPQVYYKPTPYINLHLNLSTPPSYGYDFDKKKTATVIFISGLAFTTAALLEDPYTFDTFWQQTPRQIMFCLGLGFTIGGGIGMINNK